MEYRSIIPTFATTTNANLGKTYSVDGFTLSDKIFNSSSNHSNISNAFDKDPNTSTRSGVSPSAGDFIEVKFPKKFLVEKYSITVGYSFDNGGDLKAWELQGLVDGAWKILHNGSHGATIETLTFEFPLQYVDAIRLIHRERHNTNSWGLTEFEIFELVYAQKILVKHMNEYKTYNKLTSSWETVSDVYPTEQHFLTKGINASSEEDISIVNELEGATILYYTDNSGCSSILKEDETVETFSVYDYISENPQAILYTETTDDIVVSTATEPYDLYEEFGDEVEVLLYTDVENSTEADLLIEANWSPLDELEGDFEVVTWTDEEADTAQRVLEITATPKPQFVFTSPKSIIGYINNFKVENNSQSYRDDVRILFGKGVDDVWYVWDFELKDFKQVDASTHDMILKNGMTTDSVSKLLMSDWSLWVGTNLSIGVFLKDNPRDTIVSSVGSISYESVLPRGSSVIENTSLYILNTTARINIEFNENILSGILSDDDLTRVQYRVLLNGSNYYPSDGSFTSLGSSPQNIELSIGSKDVKIDDWNTLRVEFQDFFGSTDYWSTQFIGTYSGLMFKDVYGDYYSSEIGQVLKYLDFGVIVAGQTTLEHEILLKNQYGYDIKDIHLYANTANFPMGMEIEFSETQTPFVPHPELVLSKTLLNNEEMPFYIRLKTNLGVTPDANGSFDITVRASKV